MKYNKKQKTVFEGKETDEKKEAQLVSQSLAGTLSHLSLSLSHTHTHTHTWTHTHTRLSEHEPPSNELRKKEREKKIGSKMSFGKEVKKVEGSWKGEGKDEEDVFVFWASCYKLSLNVSLNSILSCPLSS